MFFTQQDYQKIADYLRLNAKKDTDFDAISDVKPDDLVAVVLYDAMGNHKNVKLRIGDLTYDIFMALINPTDSRISLFIIDEDGPTEGDPRLVRSDKIWHAINDDNVIDTHQIKDDAIKTSKIEDKNVTNPKLADESVDDRVLNAAIHGKIEKLAAYLTGTIKEVLSNSSETTISSPIEINGKVHKWYLTANAKVESYGDADPAVVNPDDMTTKTFTVTAAGVSTTVEGQKSGDNWIGTYTIPNVAGSYSTRFDVTYNNVAKSATISASVNLRKYFGFNSTTPEDVTSLGTSNFSNSVGCTVTIPATNNGFLRIYFAVPNNMEITRVTLPDALNAPLAISYVGTVSRAISGISSPFTYKLYQSTDLVDSTASKRLTIA